MALQNLMQRSHPLQINYYRHFVAQHLSANNTQYGYQMYDIKGKKNQWIFY